MSPQLPQFVSMSETWVKVEPSTITHHLFLDKVQSSKIFLELIDSESYDVHLLDMHMKAYAWKYVCLQHSLEIHNLFRRCPKHTF